MRRRKVRPPEPPRVGSLAVAVGTAMIARGWPVADAHQAAIAFDRRWGYQVANEATFRELLADLDALINGVGPGR